MLTVLCAKVLSKHEEYTREECKSECEKYRNLRNRLDDKIRRRDSESLEWEDEEDEEDEEEWDK